MKTILLICTAITFCSCSSYEPKTYRITTTTMTCPKDYMYNSYDENCYYTKPIYTIPEPLARAIRPSTIVTKRHVKVVTKKKEEIDCVKALHYCGVNDGKL